MRARAQSSLAALDPASSRAIIPMTRQGTVVEIDGAVGARLGDRDGEIRDAHLMAARKLFGRPAKNSGSSIELNFRDDNWNNDEWIRAQPASKSAELLFRLEHFLVFE